MIRLTIQRKVFLATFILATTLVLLLALAMRWNLGQGFERYTTAAEFARLDWRIATSCHLCREAWINVRPAHHGTKGRHAPRTMPARLGGKT